MYSSSSFSSVSCWWLMMRMFVLLSCRSHYTSCLSVCPVRAYNSKTKKMHKNQNWLNRVSGVKKVKDTGRKNHTKLAPRLLTGGRSSSGGSGTDFKLSCAIVRPNWLSAPEHKTLGSWTDGRPSCWLGRWHAFLFVLCRNHELKKSTMKKGFPTSAKKGKSSTKTGHHKRLVSLM